MAPTRPASASDPKVNLVGLLCLCAAAVYLVRQGTPANVAVPLLLLAAGVPILALDVVVHRVHRRPSTGIDWTLRRERDSARIVTKWVGGLAAVGLVALGYFALPEYSWHVHLFTGPYTNFYAPYYEFLDWFGPLFLLLGAASLAWLDAYLVDPRDGHWHLGAFLLGQRSGVDLRAAADVLRMWIIRGYFLPLMFIYAGANLGNAAAAAQAADRMPFVYWFELLYNSALLVDVCFAAIGLIVVSRIFDTHPRTTDTAGPGWMSTLMFYQPFLSVFATQYFAYQSQMRWGQWLGGQPELKTAFGTAILVFVWARTLSTVSFGCRFSNLTNRGILTGWTYAWTKHPVYVADVVSMVLIGTPFLYEGDVSDVVRRLAMVTLLAGMYWVRARAEERHLSSDPDYVRYALYMNERSLFSPLGRVFPFLRYRPPPGAALVDPPAPA